MNDKLREALGTSIYFLVVIVVTLLVIKFVGQKTVVYGDSMNNTLFDGNHLIFNKISYRFHEPERFDIVVFPFRDGSGKNYVKRVIGLPGETIQLTESGDILIDGEVLEENYGREVIKKFGSLLEPMTLADDEYFVMGDNRNDSFDSRYYEVGNVKREKIIGRAWMRVYPFNKIGLVNKKKGE